MTSAQAKQYTFLQERVQVHIGNGSRRRAQRLALALAAACMRNHRNALPGANVVSAVPPANRPGSARPPQFGGQAPLQQAQSAVRRPAAHDPDDNGISAEADAGDHASLRFAIFFQAADFFLEDGEYGHSEPLFQEALRVVDEHPEAVDDLEVAHIHHNFASAHDELGDESGAERHYLAALEILDRIDELPLEQIANVSNNLAMIARNRGDLEKAEERYLRAKEIFETLHGPVDLDVAVVCNNLGSLYWAWHHPEMACDLHRRALDIRLKLLDEHHPDVGQSACNLAAVYHDLGDFEKADKHYRRGLKILREHAAQDPESYQAVAQNYAELLTENDLEKKAAQMLSKVAKHLKKLAATES